MEGINDFEKYNDASEKFNAGEGFDNSNFGFKMLSTDVDVSAEDRIIKLLKRNLSAIYDDSIEGFFNIFIIIEYLKWICYLKQVLHFFRCGVLHKVFKWRDTLQKCQISEFKFDIITQLEYTVGINAILREGVCYMTTDYASKSLSKEKLDFNLDIIYLRPLDLALILNDKQVIESIIAQGINEVSDISFTIPYFQPGPKITFGTIMINLKEQLESYSSVAKGMNIQMLSSNDKPNDKGLNNLFNGNRIMPHDDTFYIDDFR